MRIALPDGVALALFIGMVLSVTLYGLALSGHFPAESRRADLRGGFGAIVLWGTMLAALLVTGLAVRFALAHLPGYAAVLAGGLAILVAPLVLKPLPDSLVDGRTGLLLFAGTAMAFAVIAFRS